MSRTTAPQASVDGRQDFDFLFGTWNVRNRRLERPLSGSTNWYEFQSTAIERPMLGGLANLEQYDAPDAHHGPIHAIAVRLFAVETRQWSISWSAAGTGEFAVPTIGGFERDVGTFVARERFGELDITVRFLWTHRGDREAHWEQAYSKDDGKVWETNWIMDFTRVSA